MSVCLNRSFYLVASISLLACGGSTGNGKKDAGPQSSGSVTMKVNGVAWASTSGTGTYTTGTGSSNVAFIAKKAGGLPDGGDEVVTLTMYNLAGPGTFEVKPFSNNEILYTVSNASDRIRTDGGVTVTTWDATAKDAEGLIPLKGTFQGIGPKMLGAANDVVISEGTFDCRIAPQN